MKDENGKSVKCPNCYSEDLHLTKNAYYNMREFIC